MTDKGWGNVIQHATVSEKGLVVIPKAVRERLGLKKGDKVAFITIGGSTSISKVEEGDPVERLFGMFAGGGRSWTEELLEERRRELEREERDLPPPRRRVADQGDSYQSE